MGVSNSLSIFICICICHLQWYVSIAHRHATSWFFWIFPMFSLFYFWSAFDTRPERSKALQRGVREEVKSPWTSGAVLVYFWFIWTSSTEIFLIYLDFKYWNIFYFSNISSSLPSSSPPRESSQFCDPFARVVSHCLSSEFSSAPAASSELTPNLLQEFHSFQFLKNCRFLCHAIACHDC